MSFLLILLLFALVWYLVLPTLRAYLRMRRELRNIQNMFGGQAQNQGRGASQTAPKRKKRTKIIDPGVGEYVEFEEISVTSAETFTADADSYTYTSETQIEDAVWEEIK